MVDKRTLRRRAEYDNKGNLVAMFASLVGENGIEPDTWYRLENGETVKC